MASGRSTDAEIAELLGELSRLPTEWQPAGSFRDSVLRRFAAHATQTPIRHSAETGVGKSTLLLSHLSDHHVVFTLDEPGDEGTLQRVRSSPLLRPGVVEFVVGPSQRTLPAHEFRDPLDLVLIDGPHAYPFPELEYYLFYPHIASGGVLAVDDVHIPTLDHLCRFLKADEMWQYLETAWTTAFFRRTESPVFDPYGDGWTQQRFNRRRHPAPTSVLDIPAAFAKRMLRRLKGI